MSQGTRAGELAGNGGAIVAQTFDLKKHYNVAGTVVGALNATNLTVHSQDFLALMGPSGSGKSTLLHLLAGIERPTSGRCMVAGADLSGMSESQLADWRNRSIGFVFQSFNLVPVLTAQENVELPLLLTRLSRAERKRQTETALELVGLQDRMDHRPAQLSGGQQQRVAIARALATDPPLILADEPTGNLDAKSAEEALHILQTLNKELKKTLVIVTHDPHAAAAAREIRYLDKGDLLERGQKPKDWSL